MYECKIEVQRSHNGQQELTQISSQALVPGDVLVVPNNCVMPCDMVLLTGSCIVNESMLTGESVPVIKNALQKVTQIYDPQVYDSIKKYTLFSGTKVIQTRGVGDQKVYALVTRTGFTTTKGSLVRDILYPKEAKFKFYQDSLIFVGIMALVAVIGFAISVP